MPGIGNFSDSFNSLDLGTGFVTCDPVESLDSMTTLRKVRFAKRDDEIKRIYSDGWLAFIDVAAELGIPHELSQLGKHQTNAKIERCNRDILRGIRALF